MPQEQEHGATHSTQDNATEALSNPGSDRQAQTPGQASAIRPQRVWTTFPPLTQHRFHPVIGYGIAVIVQIIFTLITLLLLRILPTFTFAGVLLILGILCSTLLCGKGPGLLSAIIGAVFINLFILPPNFTWDLSTTEDITETCLFLIVGSIIGLTASQIEAARTEVIQSHQQMEELIVKLQTEQEISRQNEQTATARAGELEAIFEAITDCLLVLDADGRLLRWNAATNELFRLDKWPGYNISQPILERVAHLQLRDIHGQLLPVEQWPHMRILRGEVFTGNQAIDVVIEPPDGQKTFLSTSGAPIRDAQGQIRGGVLLSHDVTRRYQLEHQIEEQATQLAAVLETVPDAIFAYAANGELLFMNAAGQALLGARMNLEALFKTIEGFNVRDEQGQPLPKKHLATARILQGETLTSANAVEEKITTGNQEKYVSVTGGPLRAGDGSIVGAVTVVHDVTERRRLEEEAARRASQLQGIFDAMIDGLVVYDQEGHILQSNAAASHILFHLADQPQQASQTFPYTLLDEQRRVLSREQDPVIRVLQGEVLTDSRTVDIRLQLPGRQEMLLNVSGSPLRDTDRHIIGAVCMFRDVTERRRLKQRALDSELQAAERAAQFEAMIEAVTDQVLVYDREGHLIFTNDAARRFNTLAEQSDYTSQTIQERLRIYTIRNGQQEPLSFEQLPITRILQGEVLMSQAAEDVMISFSDKPPVLLNVTGAPIRDPQGNLRGGVLICRDVTERRVLEQRTHNALEALLAMAQIVVQGEAIDEEANTPTHNYLRRLAELTCNVLGCQRVSLTAVEPETEILRPLAIVGLPAELEQQWWNDRLQQRLRLSDHPNPSFAQCLRDNRALVLDTTQYPPNTPSNPYGIRNAVVAPMHVSHHLIGFLSLDYADRNHRYTPEEIRLAEAVAKLAALAVERERLLSEQTEARAKELALREANRRMNEFLGIAAHEIRTPLTTIRANVQLAKRSLKGMLTQNLPMEEIITKIAQVQGFLDRADRQTSVQSRLVSDLLDVTRIHADQLELHITRCDLVAIVGEMIENQRSITSTRTIHFKNTTAGEVFVQADADRLGQVVSNYLSNALKYSEASYPVDVYLQATGPRSVRVSVRDEGPGLASDQQELIWERFYRADGVVVQSGSGVGLGLGLYISRTIIERQGGQVGVHSQPGSGSTFWFTFPTETALPS